MFRKMLEWFHEPKIKANFVKPTDGLLYRIHHGEGGYNNQHIIFLLKDDVITHDYKNIYYLNGIIVASLRYGDITHTYKKDDVEAVMFWIDK